VPQAAQPGALYAEGSAAEVQLQGAPVRGGDEGEGAACLLATCLYRMHPSYRA
jgi:hypothetical protein